MEPDKKETGKRLHAAIERAGKTREDVADAAGVSPGTVQRWQAGSMEPGLFAFAMAALAIGTTPDVLLGLDPSKLPQPGERVLRQSERALLDDLQLLAPPERAAIARIVGALADAHKAQSKGNRQATGTTGKSHSTARAEEHRNQKPGKG